MPIGRAIGGAVVQVVDSAVGVCPQGVSGEVVIGGAGLALGYLAMLLARHCGAVRARSVWSSRVTALPDGGSRPRRRQRLVGVRRPIRRPGEGARACAVEPEEVAAALRQHPGVSDAAVVGRTDGSGSTQLIGYVVGEVVPLEVRRFVGALLPEFMVPGRVVVVGSLPDREREAGSGIIAVAGVGSSVGGVGAGGAVVAGRGGSGGDLV